MKHTPGPWYIQWYENDGICVAKSVGPIVPDHNHWAGWYVANEPDACLVAAAPDLLAACKNAMEECVDLIATDAGNALEAAIAKAEGREP